MSFIQNLFSQRYYIYWIEVLVILAIVVFLVYLAYTLGLFKKE